MLQGRGDREPRRRGIPRIKELLAAGVVRWAQGRTASTTPSTPSATPTRSRCALIVAHAAQLGTPDEIAAALRMVTDDAARLLRLPDYGIVPGARADLVVLDAETARATRCASRRRAAGSCAAAGRGRDGARTAAGAMTDTPTRILEAAWAIVIERETVDVTVAEIAAAAGVSRQLVYFHFDNRAGLLTAMARHRDESSGFVDEVAASRRCRRSRGSSICCARGATTCRRSCRSRAALEAALVTGDDGGSAWRQRMGELRAALRIAVDRVELAPGWTVDQAADWAWSRIQPTTWQHLVGERGWSAEQYTERTVGSLLGELIGPRT